MWLDSNRRNFVCVPTLKQSLAVKHLSFGFHWPSSSKRDASNLDAGDDDQETWGCFKTHLFRRGQVWKSRDSRFQLSHDWVGNNYSDSVYPDKKMKNTNTVFSGYIHVDELWYWILYNSTSTSLSCSTAYLVTALHSTSNLVRLMCKLPSYKTVLSICTLGPAVFVMIVKFFLSDG